MRTPRVSVLALVLAASAALPCIAGDTGRWTLGVGVHQVAPRSGNGALANGTLPVDVGNDVRPTVTAEYRFAGGWGVEVLAALPFEHDIAIDGLGTVGSTRHLPPVVSLQYHFLADRRASPFLGAGVNYTAFFEEDTRGALAGSRLSLADSWGTALHAGVDIRTGPRSALRIDARWIDIDSEVSVDGARLGRVAIDPRVYGVAWVTGF